MKIVQLDTVSFDEFPNLIYIEIITDEGLVGLGESFFGPQSIEAYIHETAASYLLGKDPLSITSHHSALRQYVGGSGTGVEMRGNSAIDVALWDLLGKSLGQPLWQVLGGAYRDSARIYNTCAGPRYVRYLNRGPAVENWGLPDDQAREKYDDLWGFLHCADEVAESLLAEGVTAMKIWPLDVFALETSGHGISSANLNEGLEPLRRIRDAVGDKIDIMVECHGLWDLATARQIARALEDLNPYWLEDPIRNENLSALSALSNSTDIPIAAGETLGGDAAFAELLDRKAASVVIVDIGWCGGVSSAKAIAAMAEAKGLLVAPHDCTGPVILAASVHLSVSLANAGLQEYVRAYYHGWYSELVTELPPIVDGRIAPTSMPGLGLSLQPGLKKLSGTRVRTSTLGDL